MISRPMAFLTEFFKYRSLTENAKRFEVSGNRVDVVNKDDEQIVDSFQLNDMSFIRFCYTVLSENTAKLVEKETKTKPSYSVIHVSTLQHFESIVKALRSQALRDRLTSDIVKGSIRTDVDLFLKISDILKMTCNKVWLHILKGYNPEMDYESILTKFRSLPSVFLSDNHMTTVLEELSNDTFVRGYALLHHNTPFSILAIVYEEIFLNFADGMIPTSYKYSLPRNVEVTYRNIITEKLLLSCVPEHLQAMEWYTEHACESSTFYKILSNPTMTITSSYVPVSVLIEQSRAVTNNLTEDNRTMTRTTLPRAHSSVGRHRGHVSTQHVRSGTVMSAKHTPSQKYRNSSDTFDGDKSTWESPRFSNTLHSTHMDCDHNDNRCNDSRNDDSGSTSCDSGSNGD